MSLPMIFNIIARLSAPSLLSSTTRMRSDDFGAAAKSFPAGASGPDASTITGSRTTNSDPLPGPSLLASILPPCISTRRLTNERPIPRPPCDFSRAPPTWVNI